MMLMRVDEARDVLPFLASPPRQNTAARHDMPLLSTLVSKLERFLLSDGQEAGVLQRQAACDLVGCGLAHIVGTIVYTPAGNGQATGRLSEQVETAILPIARNYLVTPWRSVLPGLRSRDDVG
jgi:hypothetical protein